MNVVLASLLVVALVSSAAQAQTSSPLFKVFCQQTPIYRGRADPIVQPGAVPSNHVHKVFGGNNFQPFPPSQWNYTSVYNQMFSSSCTTCSITADKSAYWVPDLYYQNLDGSLALVPVGGLTVYYFGRTGVNTSLPYYNTYKAFPPGFRMVAGNPFVRNFTGTIAAQGPSFACLSNPGGPETNYFPTTNRYCVNGLRAQVFFPMCWDGVNLDSPTHTTHVAYPLQNYNSGDCPASHPVRLPAIFYEVLYSVDQFPHGNGRQPFVFACGDPTGYGMHGDFLNGWDVNILQAAMNNVTCYANNTNNGNNPEYCLPLTPYIKANNPDQSCQLATPIANYEDLGFARNISHLPGCENITVINLNSDASIQAGSPIPDGIYPGTSKPRISGSAWRVLIQSSLNNQYVTATGLGGYLTATVSSSLTYNQVFVMASSGTANTYSLQSEYNGEFVTAQQTAYPLQAARNNPSTWETFTVGFLSSGTAPNAAGIPVTLLSNSDNNYVAVNATGFLIANGPTAGSAATASTTFYLIDADANQVNSC